MVKRTVFNFLCYLVPSIKFDFQISESNISYLDTMVYIEGNKLMTKMHTKPTYKHTYLHKSSYHPYSLKKSIIYSQALRVKRICTKTGDYNDGIKALFNSFRERGYDEEELHSGFSKAADTNREDLLQYKNRTQSRSIPLVVTYNKHLPNIKNTIDNNWNILKINQKLSKCFEDQPIIAYRRNKNLKDFIGQTKVTLGSISRGKTRTIQTCSPCRSRPDNLCCKQVLTTNRFKSSTTHKEYSIFHKRSCKSSYVIYLLECKKCHIQYVGKSQMSLNLRINNHRKDAKNPQEDSIPAAKHFNQAGHEFSKYGRFTIIEQIGNMPTEKRDAILRQREVFWIIKLGTLTPNGLNQDTNC